MLTVKSCCCGCTLKTGTKIILWSHSAVGFYIYQKISDLKFHWMIVCDVKILHYLFDILELAFFVGIPFGGLVGVDSGRRLNLIPFLVTQWLFMMVGIFLMVALAIDGRAVLTHLGFDLSVFILPRFLITLEVTILLGEGINFYCFVVVLSYYKELMRDNST